MQDFYLVFITIDGVLFGCPLSCMPWLGMFKSTDFAVGMSPKLKCCQNWNIINTVMSPTLKCQQNLKVTNTEMSLKLKCHINWNITQTEMSAKLKSDQNWNIT